MDKPPPPRIELHTHLEGSVTPRHLIQLADKYGRSEIAVACLTVDGESYRFEGFGGFLELYKNLTLLLRTPGDFHAVALDLGRQLAADNVFYAEVTVSYGVMLQRGIDPRAVQRALAEATVEIAEVSGVTVGWTPDAVRQWGPDAAWRAWEAAAVAGRDLGVVGFGLGGDEAAAGPELFGRLFAEVRAEGYGVTIHAGEAAGPQSVRQAVIVCGASRIGHGVTAAADEETMKLLSDGPVFVELCPGSNLRTGVIAEAAAHPLRTFLDAGIPCNLNSDDRALFELDLAGEYERAAETHQLSEAEATTMTRQALAAAFDPEAAAAAARRAGFA